MKLFLITEGFPYGKAERTFITPELTALSEKYEVQIVACTNRHAVLSAEDIADVPANVKFDYIETEFSGHGIKSKALILGYALKTLFGTRFLKECSLLKKTKGKITLQALYDILFFDMTARRYYSILENKYGNELDDSIIYTFWNNTFTLSAVGLKRKHKNLKVFSRIHGYDLFEERTASGIWQPFKTVIDKDIDMVFFICNQGYEYYIKHFGDLLNKEKYHIAYMGVSPKEKANDISCKHTFELVSCSSVIKLKRLDKIIEAIDLLPEDISLHWTHFGAGNLFENIKQLAAKKLTGKSNISYDLKGFTPNNEVMEYYKNTPVDCFIMTSETEGLPVSIMEALSYGIPVIAPDVGGISEEIDGNGILLSADPTAKEIKDAICEVYKENNISSLREKSRKIWQEKFNSEANAQKLIDLMWQ